MCEFCPDRFAQPQARQPTTSPLVAAAGSPEAALSRPPIDSTVAAAAAKDFCLPFHSRLTERARLPPCFAVASVMCARGAPALAYRVAVAGRWPCWRCLPHRRHRPCRSLLAAHTWSAQWPRHRPPALFDRGAACTGGTAGARRPGGRRRSIAQPARAGSTGAAIQAEACPPPPTPAHDRSGLVSKYFAKSTR